MAVGAWVTVDQIWYGATFNMKVSFSWALIALAVGVGFQVTSPLYRFTGSRDVLQLSLATFTLVGLSLLARFLLLGMDHDLHLPNSSLAASCLTGLFWSTIRIGRRVTFETSFKRMATPSSLSGSARRTLLVGAGKAGSLVAQELLDHPELGYKVVGFIDDSNEKLGSRIRGIRILGKCSSIAKVTETYKITHAILAMPTAGGETVRQIIATFQDLRVKVKTVPGIFNLLGARNWKPDIQEISIEDVLRREPVQLEDSAMTEGMKELTVLITGAGGSIGGELARQVAGYHPRLIILLGRGENSLWQIQRDIQAHFPDQAFSVELMDIRNRHGLREIFERFHPDMVLHAAAHKHVPFLETHPCEAVENNILGTFNVMEAARDFQTRRVVNISTDKAVNPTNVLGASKRLAECIVLHMAQEVGPRGSFSSVRFGNVLGSRGSVVPIFRDQIEHGGPITVTHPDMTRFFMTIPEASQLVLQTALFGESSRVYVLNMGTAVKIVDLATDMAKLSGLVPGRDIRINFVGMRPGEKLHEELFMDEELRQANFHPKLMEANPQPLPTSTLEEMLQAFRKAVTLPYEERQPEIVRLLRIYVPTYTPSPLGVGKYGGHVKNRRQVNSGVPTGPERRAQLLS